MRREVAIADKLCNGREREGGGERVTVTLPPLLLLTLPLLPLLLLPLPLLPLLVLLSELELENSGVASKRSGS